MYFEVHTGLFGGTIQVYLGGKEYIWSALLAYLEG